MNSPRWQGLTIAMIGAVLAMIGGNTHVLDYISNALNVWSGRPQFSAVVVGIIAGGVFTSWVPYVFDSEFKKINGCPPCSVTPSTQEEIEARVSHMKRKARIETMLRLASSLLTFVICWRLVPTEHGFHWAIIAGFGGAQVYMSGTRLIYIAFPWLKPEALRAAPPVVAMVPDAAQEPST